MLSSKGLVFIMPPTNSKILYTYRNNSFSLKQKSIKCVALKIYYLFLFLCKLNKTSQKIITSNCELYCQFLLMNFCGQESSCNIKVGTHDGTSPCDYSLQQVGGTSRIV